MEAKSFEDSLRRLEQISGKLAAENTGLEESINLYEEGIILAKECYNKLKEAELKVINLRSGIEEIFNKNDEKGD